MVAFNFKEDFVPGIIGGSKIGTIRKTARCRPGERMQLYTGLRTFEARQFADAICDNVRPVIVNIASRSIMVAGTPVDSLNEFARGDGFSHPDYLFEFFEETYKKPQFMGFWHTWRELKPGAKKQDVRAQPGLFGQTVEEYSETLRNMVENGDTITCECCGALSKIYNRRIHGKIARDLISLYQHGGHINDVYYRNFITKTDQEADFYLTELWGLTKRGESAGHWGITPLGVEYVLNNATIPEKAKVYRGQVLEFVGQRVLITDALGKKFDYDEVMGYT